MSGLEYRVVWRREDQQRRFKIYQSERSAIRLAEGIRNLTAEYPGDDPDGCAVHFWCEAEDGDCVTNRRAWEKKYGDLPPLVEEPIIQTREVGDWSVAGGET